LFLGVNIFDVRQTKQHVAIESAIKKAGRPLSPGEVLAAARKSVADLGIATVYRNLKSLQSDGEIIQVALPGQPARWEKAKQEHHHHFLCRGCDRLIDIQIYSKDLLGLLPDGYILEDHDVLLRGLCADCARKKSRL
jgi:Fur family ferric uptake transcriptional regulator